MADVRDQVRPSEIWLVLVGVPTVGALAGHLVFAVAGWAVAGALYFGSLRWRPWWPSRCCGGTRKKRTGGLLSRKAYAHCTKCKNGERLRWGVRVFMPGLAAKEMEG